MTQIFKIAAELAAPAPNTGFSPMRLILPAGVLLLAVLLGLCAVKLPAKGRKILSITVAGLCFALVTALAVWDISRGNVKNIALYLCAVPAAAGLAGSVFGWQLGRDLCWLCFPAALAGLLRPELSVWPPELRNALSAALLALLTLLPALFVGDGHRPAFRRLPWCALVLLGFSGAAAAGDWFWFGGGLLTGVLSNTPAAALTGTLGYFGTAAAMFLAVLALWALMELPFVHPKARYAFRIREEQ